MATDKLIEKYLVYRVGDELHSTHSAYNEISIVSGSITIEEFLDVNRFKYVVDKDHTSPQICSYLYNGTNRFYSNGGFLSEDCAPDVIFEILAIGNADASEFVALIQENVSMEEVVGWKQLGTIPVVMSDNYKCRNPFLKLPVSLSEIISRNWKIKAIRNEIIIYVNDETDAMELKLRL